MRTPIHVAAALTLLIACGGAPANAPASPAQNTRRNTPLVTWTPAGAEFIASLRVAALFSDPATRIVLDGFFPAEKIETFRARTGIDPTSVEEFVFAKFPNDDGRSGSFMFVRGIDADLVVRELGARMTAVAGQRDVPFARRVGVLDDDPIDASAPWPDVMTLGLRAPEPTSAFLSGLEDPNVAPRPALTGPDADALLVAARQAPIAFYVPRHLELPEESGLGVLLARQRALAVFIEPISADMLRIRVSLRGEFPSTASSNFRTLATSVATSNVGRALGLEDGLETLTIAVADDEIDIAMDVLARRFVQGLRLMWVAEMQEMLGAEER